MKKPKILLVDHFDSFTYNLYALIAQVSGIKAEVINLWEKPALALDEYMGIVLGPGPGHPKNSEDVGHSPKILRDARVPILGVCLGLQIMAHEAGLEVIRAPRPRHGIRDKITIVPHPLFAGLNTGLRVIRYHSLCVARAKSPMISLAQSDDGVIQAIASEEAPHFGVQFHPESIGTEGGERLMTNFWHLCCGWRAKEGQTFC